VINLIRVRESIHERKFLFCFKEVYRDVCFTIITARRYASMVYAVVVCLSVRPSVPLSVRHKPALKAKRRITQTTPYDISGTLVF